jgi:hypothetical protein
MPPGVGQGDACLAPSRKEIDMFGLSEQEIRERLQEELVRAMHAEGDAPTIHALAHSVARIIEEDHLRMAEQLERAGVRVEDAATTLS